MIEDRILAEIREAADTHRDWESLGVFSGRSSPYGLHLAVMVEPFLTYILDGSKTIESRFSKNMIAPFKRVHEGDVVFLKSGPLVASFRATSPEFIELDETERKRLARDHSDEIRADEEFWQARQGKNYATLIGISEVRPLTPVKVSKNDRRGWIVLRDSTDGPQALQHEQLSFM